MDFDKMQDECGVFGTFGIKDVDVASLTYVGLHALQHRGQESAGIAVTDGDRISIHKNMGLLADVFDENRLSTMKGNASIGHVRYSTVGSSHITNAQPLLFTVTHGDMAFAHNGSLTNINSMKEMLCQNGSVFHTTNDSEIIAHLVARYNNGNIVEALQKAMVDIKGAYSVVMLEKDRLIGMRDPQGYRPLCLGKLNGGYILASESCALSVVGAEYIREIEPGEVVVIDGNGVESHMVDFNKEMAFCIFEYVYIARPDSQFEGLSVSEARKRMGANIYKECNIDADVVMAVPDSGICAAIGYSHASGIPYESGLIKNRYVGRTFIQPTQIMRETSVRLKLSPVRDIIEGKRVILVDDSIVRGTTSKQIIKMVKDAGAKEVYLLISSPPVIGSCYFGVDTQKKDLIATTHSVDEIREFIGADKLYFLSEEGLMNAVKPSGVCGYCTACFSNEYKTEVENMD